MTCFTTVLYLTANPWSIAIVGAIGIFLGFSLAAIIDKLWGR